MKLAKFDFRIYNSQKGTLEQAGVCGISDTSSSLSIEFKKGDEIELWSGFKDNKGKKIYEGDIVKCLFTDECGNVESVEGAVELQEGIFRLEAKGTNYARYAPYLQFCHNFSVLGNIHENPELLNKGA